MEIIQNNALTAQVICRKCTSILQISKRDIQPLAECGKIKQTIGHIDCPCCGALIHLVYNDDLSIVKYFDMP